MEELVSTYGYPAIIAGTFFEGETIVLIGGYLANRGYLTLEWAILCAFLGSWAGDTVYFLIGRRWGHKLLGRFPSWQPAADRSLDMLHRYHTAFILVFRFLYGLRTVSPFVIGMSRVSTVRFVLLNMTAAAIWATAFTGGGYLLGTLLESLIAKVERYEAYVLSALVAGGLIVWLGHAYFLRRRRRSAIAARPGAPAAPRRAERQDDGS